METAAWKLIGSVHIDIIKFIIKEYKKGASLKKLSVITGFHVRTIRRHLYENNVKIRSVKEAVALIKRKPIKLNENDIIDIVNSYKKGIKVSILAKKYGMTSKGILYQLKKNKVKIRKTGENRKYKIRENYFDRINKEGPLYFLGFLYSDGYNATSKGQVSASQDDKDVDILYKFKNQISIDGLLEIKRYRKKSSGFRKKSTIANTILLCSKKLSNRLKELGCVQKKTNILKFPLKLDKRYIRHFLRGYMDGDGNIFCGKSISVSLTGTMSFTSYLSVYLKHLLNIETKISTEHRCKSNIKKLCINKKRDCLKFLNWLYKDSKIYGDRKYKTYLEVKNRV